MNLKHLSVLVAILGLSACSRSSGEFHYTSHVISGLKNQVISICAEIESEHHDQNKQFCKLGATDASGKMQISLHGSTSDLMDATAKLLNLKFFALINGKKVEFTSVDTSDVRFFDDHADGSVRLNL